MNTSNHVIGYSWKENRPSLAVRAWPEDKALEFLSLEGELHLQLSDMKICPGYGAGPGVENIVPCEQQNPLPTRGRKQRCSTCDIRWDFKRCMACNGKWCRNPVRKSDCLATEHEVYLGVFGADMAKVGTSTAWRKEERITEQGPYVAAFIATANGMLVRGIEKAISQIGLTERMRGKAKFEGLYPIQPETLMTTVLQTAYEKVRSRISAECKPYLHEPVFLSLYPIYGLSKIYTQPLPLALVENSVLSGRVVAVKGSLCVLERDHKLYAFDLADLRGWVVDTCPSQATAPVQMSLF